MKYYMLIVNEVGMASVSNHMHPFVVQFLGTTLVGGSIIHDETNHDQIMLVASSMNCSNSEAFCPFNYA